MKDAAPETESMRAAREGSRRYLEHLESELARLQAELSALAARSPDSAEYVTVEERNTKLANIYVSCARLDGAADREEVLVAIQEIVINVIGSEELAVFGVDAEAPCPLDVLTSFGMNAERLASLAAGHGAVGRAARGEACIGSDVEAIAREEAGLTACVPITVGGAVTGVLAIFHLLPHKSDLDDGDRELIDILARQAGNALHRTRAMQ